MDSGTPAGHAAPIGVFDSGTGGLSVLRALREALPHEEFIYLDDSGHGPYGERDAAFVTGRTLAIADHLRGHRIKALVVACNTATAAAADAVRDAHPDLPVVGVEPALKPAVGHSRTRRIGVIATRGTLASERFGRLQAAVGKDAAFVLQPCDGLAAAIDAMAEGGNGQGTVEALCRRYLGAMGPFGTRAGEVDTLVLGCTHYVLVQPLLQSIAGPQVRLIATGEAVARQTVRRLPEPLQKMTAPTAGALALLTTGDPDRLTRAARYWLPDADGVAARAVAGG